MTVLAYQRRPDPICDVCGEPIDGDPCEPHSKRCPRTDHSHDDCDCDWQTHPECCWMPDCAAVCDPQERQT